MVVIERLFLIQDRIVLKHEAQVQPLPHRPLLKDELPICEWVWTLRFKKPNRFLKPVRFKNNIIFCREVPGLARRHYTSSSAYKPSCTFCHWLYRPITDLLLCLNLLVVLEGHQVLIGKLLYDLQKHLLL